MSRLRSLLDIGAAIARTGETGAHAAEKAKAGVSGAAKGAQQAERAAEKVIVDAQGLPLSRVAGKSAEEAISEQRQVTNYMTTVLSSDKKTYLKPEEIHDFRKLLADNDRFTLTNVPTNGMTKEKLAQDLVDGKKVSIGDFDKFISQDQSVKAPATLGLPRWLGGFSMEMPQWVKKSLVAVGLTAAGGYVTFVDANFITQEKDGGFVGITRYAISGAPQEQTDARIAEAGRDKKQALTAETDKERELRTAQANRGSVVGAGNIAGQLSSGRTQTPAPAASSSGTAMSTVEMGNLLNVLVSDPAYGLSGKKVEIDKAFKDATVNGQLDPAKFDNGMRAAGIDAERRQIVTGLVLTPVR